VYSDTIHAFRANSRARAQKRRMEAEAEARRQRMAATALAEQRRLATGRKPTGADSKPKWWQRRLLVRSFRFKLLSFLVASSSYSAYL
jgi:hypothetical protein